MIWFGPAGQDAIFPTIHKSSLDMPEYLAGKGLNAFEYQCGHGVRVTEKTARALAEKCREYGIRISLHAPYYISLASPEEEKRANSVEYILSSARAVDWMGGNRIVVHPGGVGKGTREEALALAAETLKNARIALDEAGLSHVHICPETMGKLGQLGTLEEILSLCAVDERMIPCIDFGHLNARSGGGCSTREEMASVLDNLEASLGNARAKVFHSHFSKIEYTSGGEKRHLTFEDQNFGPDFAPLARLVLERGMEPVFICESSGAQIEDAAAMKSVYESLTI